MLASEIVRHVRGAEIDARRVTDVQASTVRLAGEVGSWSETEAIEKALMHSPGLTGVDNQITVAPRPARVPSIDDEIC